MTTPTLTSNTQPIARRMPVTALVGIALLLGLSSALLAVAVPENLKLAVLLCGLFFVVATLINAMWGLLGLVLINYTNLTDVAIKYHGAPTFVQEAFVALILVAIAVRVFLKGQYPSNWQTPALLVSAYTISGLLSVFYATDANTALRDAISYVKFPVITMLVVLLLDRAAYLRYVIWTLLVTGILLGSISSVQYLTGTFENPYWGLARPPIVDVNNLGESTERLAGPIGDPNFFAQVMLVLVPLALDRIFRERSLVLRALAAFCLAVSLITIAGTYSRGAYLGLFAVAGILLWRYRPHPILLPALVAAVIFAVPFVPEQYVERFTSLADNIPGVEGNGPKEADPSLQGRTSEAIAAAMMFRDHPLLGVGLGNYNTLYLRYSTIIGIDARLENRSAHSLYLEIAAERGLLGLTLFGFIVYAMFSGLRRADRDLTAAGLHDEAGMVYALSAGMVSYMLTSTFLHDAYPRYFWLLLGICLAAPNVARNELARVQAALPNRPQISR
jgi:putative inorganic carbon (hco3(-)) transporter